MTDVCREVLLRLRDEVVDTEATRCFLSGRLAVVAAQREGDERASGCMTI